MIGEGDQRVSVTVRDRMISVEPRLPLRGRQRELGLITARIEAVLVGQEATVLVEGTAGIGKTRLIDEALTFADAGGFAILHGAADELNLVVPLASLVAALRSGGEPILSAGDLPGLPVYPDDRLGLLEELRDRIERAASTNPIAIVIEDIQWAAFSDGLRSRPSVERDLGLPG